MYHQSFYVLKVLLNSGAFFSILHILVALVKKSNLKINISSHSIARINEARTSWNESADLVVAMVPMWNMYFENIKFSNEHILNWHA